MLTQSISKSRLRARSLNGFGRFGIAMIDIDAKRDEPVSNKLKSYGAAKREILPGVEHQQHKGLNNQAENSHQPTRLREKKITSYVRQTRERVFSIVQH